MSSVALLHLEKLSQAAKLFQRKFNKVREKLPLYVSFTMDAEGIEVYRTPQSMREENASEKQLYLKKPWPKDIEIATESKIKRFIHDIKAELASGGYYPIIIYRKFEDREMTPSEAISTLLKKGEEISDGDMFVKDVKDWKPFIVYEIDHKKKVVTLLDEGDNKYLFKYALTEELKYYLDGLGQGDVDDTKEKEEAGRHFFSSASFLMEIPNDK